MMMINKILVILPVLLFCGMAKGLWCFDHSSIIGTGERIFCYACGEEQCYKEVHEFIVSNSQLTDIPDDYDYNYGYDEEQNKKLKDFLGLHDFYIYGCTTEMDHHLCNTTEEQDTWTILDRNITKRTRISCCTSSKCNDDGKY